MEILVHHSSCGCAWRCFASLPDDVSTNASTGLLLYQVLEWRIWRWTAAGRQVIVVGDLNISPAPIDSCAPHPIPQFLQRPDRVWLGKLLGPEGPGMMDVFRHFHPNRYLTIRVACEMHCQLLAGPCSGAGGPSYKEHHVLCCVGGYMSV